MVNIYEILQRAASLKEETALNSISPERAGGIMYDTLLALNDLWLQQGSALVISKIYASVAAMEADTAPVSDLTGKPLRPGQIVVIASSDSDNGSVYRYNGTDAPSWSLVGAIGNLTPVDSLDSDSTQLPLAAHQGKVLDGKISQLGQDVKGLEMISGKAITTLPTITGITMTDSSGFSCIALRVYPGEVYAIRAKGGSQYSEAYATYDKDLNLVRRYGVYSSIFEGDLTIQDEEVILIVNSVNSVSPHISIAHGVNSPREHAAEDYLKLYDVDSTPQSGSQKFVTSDGIFNFKKFLGTQFPGLTSTDSANSVIENSIYFANNAQGMPITGVFLLVTMASTSTSSAENRWITQIAIADANAGQYVRTAYYNNGVANWSAWKQLANVSDILSYIGNNAITRSKLSNDFMCNYPNIPATGDMNDALTEGHYLVISGASNAPIAGTMTLEVKTFKPSASGNTWTIQVANTADSEMRSFMRKCYNGSNWSDWVETTNNYMDFRGKKIACFGDSITERGDYPSRLAEKLRATTYKCGFGGCRMTSYSNTESSTATGYSAMCMSYLSDYIADNDFTDLLQAADDVYAQYGDDNRTQALLVSQIDYSKLDYMILFWGTNDYGGNMPIGQDTDEGHTTFKGAINLIVKNILTAYPNIHLIFFTPFWRATYTGESGFCDSDTYTNPLGFKLPDYVDALVSRANALHIPVVNLYDSMCIGKYNYEEWLVDGLHPKDGVGYEYVAEKVASGFKRFYHD